MTWYRLAEPPGGRRAERSFQADLLPPLDEQVQEHRWRWAEVVAFRKGVPEDCSRAIPPQTVSSAVPVKSVHLGSEPTCSVRSALVAATPELPKRPLTVKALEHVRGATKHL